MKFSVILILLGAICLSAGCVFVPERGFVEHEHDHAIHNYYGR